MAILATGATATSTASADHGQGLGTAEARVGLDRLATPTAATIGASEGDFQVGLGRQTHGWRADRG